jgi:hypothetical protein
MKSDWSKIEEQAKFADDRERAHVRAVYEEAIALLEQRLHQHGGAAR